MFIIETHGRMKFSTVEGSGHWCHGDAVTVTVGSSQDRNCMPRNACLKPRRKARSACQGTSKGLAFNSCGFSYQTLAGAVPRQRSAWIFFLPHLWEQIEAFGGRWTLTGSDGLFLLQGQLQTYAGQIEQLGVISTMYRQKV